MLSEELPLSLSPEDREEFLKYLTARLAQHNYKVYTPVDLKPEPYELYVEKLDIKGNVLARFKVAISDTIRIELVSRGNISEKVVKSIALDLEKAILRFNDNYFVNKLYLTFVENATPLPFKLRYATLSRVVEKFFTDSTIYLFMLIVLIGFVAFVLFEKYAPLAIIVASFVLLAFSGKILGLLGDWTINEKSQSVFIVQMSVSPQSFQKALSLFRNANVVLNVKKEIYARTLALGSPIEPEVCREVLESYGFPTEDMKISVRRVNLYGIVEELSRKYGLKTPKIKLANIVLPNAAAAGVFKRGGTLIVTTGLLLMLNEEEIKSVIAHELSHINNRDPLYIFAVALLEYVFRLNLVNVIPSRYLFLAFPYLLFAIVGLFFFAKIIETRADITAALATDPSHLRSALSKIGYRKLIKEMAEENKLKLWLNFNSHPPLVSRLKYIKKVKAPIKNALAYAFSTCFNDLLSASRRW